MREHANMREGAAVGVELPTHEPVAWRARWTVEKFRAPTLADAIESGETPYEVIEREGNLLVFGGASALWDLLIGGGNVTAFSNANAHIGVGDSATAAAATQTDLQAATNKERNPMEATFPAHTDGTVDGSDDVQFKSSFADAEANFAWNEWGIFNASSLGRMLNRKVESLGTKAGGTWTLTVTLSLA